MTLDANNEQVDQPVEMPSTTSSEGIEAHLDKQAQTAESSPASEENHEEKTNGVQKRINELTAKRYQAEREKDELQRELAALKANAAAVEKMPESTPSNDLQAPSLPDDIYDEEAMKAYHQANLDYQGKLAEKKAQDVYNKQQQQKAEQEKANNLKNATERFAQNAIRDGVDLDKMHVAEQVIVNAGVSTEVGKYLLNDDKGAKIVEYLADNQSELYELVNLDPVTAAVKIATEIKPKAISQTQNVSKAPDPVPNVSGGGYVEKDDFDKKYPGVEFI